MDYILFAQTSQDIRMQPSPNEVMDTRYVDAQELRQMFAQCERGEILLTPWFRLICDNFLFQWWKRLDNLPASEEQSVIHAL